MINITDEGWYAIKKRNQIKEILNNNTWNHLTVSKQMINIK